MGSGTSSFRNKRLCTGSLNELRSNQTLYLSLLPPDLLRLLEIYINVSRGIPLVGHCRYFFDSPELDSETINNLRQTVPRESQHAYEKHARDSFCLHESETIIALLKCWRFAASSEHGETLPTFAIFTSRGLVTHQGFFCWAELHGVRLKSYSSDGSNWRVMLGNGLLRFQYTKGAQDWSEFFEELAKLLQSIPPVQPPVGPPPTTFASTSEWDSATSACVKRLLANNHECAASYPQRLILRLARDLRCEPIMPAIGETELRQVLHACKLVSDADVLFIQRFCSSWNKPTLDLVVRSRDLVFVEYHMLGNAVYRISFDVLGEHSLTCIYETGKHERITWRHGTSEPVVFNSNSSSYPTSGSQRVFLFLNVLRSLLVD